MTKNLTKPNAAYQIVAQPGGSFGVQVLIEDTSPTLVTSFPTEAAAETWIENREARILNPPFRARWRTKAK